MNNYFYLNVREMIRISKDLKGSEIKMLYAMMYCMGSKNTKLFINSAENRNLMETIGFSKTPERISTLLGALVRKGIIKREVNGVYSLPANLFLYPSDSSEISPNNII